VLQELSLRDVCHIGDEELLAKYLKYGASINEKNDVRHFILGLFRYLSRTDFPIDYHSVWFIRYLFYLKENLLIVIVF